MSNITCTLCHGRGNDVQIECTNCEGTGYDPMDEKPFAQCHSCYGIGVEELDTCPRCFGDGLIVAEVIDYLPLENDLYMPKNEDYEDIFNRISKRYSDVDPEALEAVLTPILIPITGIDKQIVKLEGQNHWRASFKLKVKSEWAHLMQRGTTGKFVPQSYKAGGVWREICKGRIVDVDREAMTVFGEIYVGKSKSALVEAVNELNIGDYLEIDQYGASAKVLSSLAEYYLAKQAADSGYTVRRMPEDTAKHLGAYYNYDFEFEKNNIVKKIEVKSIWGTNTDYARLIHSTTSKPKGNFDEWTVNQIKNYYPTRAMPESGV